MTRRVESAEISAGYRSSKGETSDVDGENFYLDDDANGQMPAMFVEYVTADGTTVNTFDAMAVPPEPFDSSSTLYTDGTATGNVSFAVPSATAGQGTLAVRPGMLTDKVFVAVQ